MKKLSTNIKLLKTIPCIITLSFFCSCAAGKISDREIEKLNGHYDANTLGHNEEHVDQHNFVFLLNRKLLKDTLRDRPLNNYSFKLKVVDKKHIQISVINESGSVSTNIYKFRRKEDCIVLKNKNIGPILVPYLAGALDVTKLKLKSGDDKNLNITINEHRSGGVFMIPMGWSNFETLGKYNRIE